MDIKNFVNNKYVQLIGFIIGVLGFLLYILDSLIGEGWIISAFKNIPVVLYKIILVGFLFFGFSLIEKLLEKQKILKLTLIVIYFDVIWFIIDFLWKIFLWSSNEVIGFNVKIFQLFGLLMIEAFLIYKSIILEKKIKKYETAAEEARRRS